MTSANGGDLVQEFAYFVTCGPQATGHGRMPTVSGMLNTDAMNFVECPNCHQPAGKLCTDRRGKKLSIQHPERVAEYQSKFKDRAPLYKDGKDTVEKVREYNRKLSKSH